MRARRGPRTRPARRPRTPDRVVAERVFEYLEHDHRGAAGRAAYVRGVFARDERRALRTLMSMLRGGDSRTAYHALRFIEEAVEFKILPAAQASRVRGALLPNVRDLVQAPDRNLRRTAVIALGRTGPRTNVRFLADLLPFFVERDPLTLPDLLFATESLGDWTAALGHAVTIAADPLYLARWALLGWAGRYGAGTVYHRRLAGLAERLEQDPHPLIREEAAALRARWQAEAGWAAAPNRAWTPAESDERVSELGRLRPSLAFEDLAIWFANYLHASQRRDYDPATLDAFVRYIQTHPHPPDQEFDHAAHARAFEAWHAAEAPP